jgi:pimeloyl-ACP methyl ester carboxylesterase
MIFLLVIAFASACGDSDDSLMRTCITSTSVPFVRPFEVSSEDYPFSSCAFDTAAGRLHYIDEGPLNSEETIVMVHGNPTWSFLYRNIATAMIEDGHRVVVMDHLGMGMSDVPWTEEFDYRPRSHSSHLEDLVIALDLQDVTLVVQDWGGPIGLGMATRQPERIKNVLIMNTWAWSVDNDNPGVYHELVAWTKQARSFPNLSPTFFCDFVLPGQSELTAAEADPTRGALYERVFAAYVSPAFNLESGDYRTYEPCAPMQIFAESIGDDDAFQGEVEQGLNALQGKPYSLLYGLSDPLFGALRCDSTVEPQCPGESICVCDDELLPARVSGGCEDPQASEYRVCKTLDGEIIDPYPSRFVEFLGAESLVSRETVTDADHMIQEWAPDRVIEALRNLIDFSEQQ